MNLVSEGASTGGDGVSCRLFLSLLFERHTHTRPRETFTFQKKKRKTKKVIKTENIKLEKNINLLWEERTWPGRQAPRPRAECA